MDPRQLQCMPECNLGHFALADGAVERFRDAVESLEHLV